MKKLLLIFCCSLFIKNTTAQLMAPKPENFSRKDSLRGTLYPERINYDVYFYALDVKVDINNKYISGSNTMYFNVKNELPVLQFDLYENLKITKVEWRKNNLEFNRTFNAVFVKFPKSLKKGDKESIKIYYEGNPTIAKRAPWDGGFVFKKDKNAKDWVGVACQGAGASLWWPNKDHQSDEPDSMSITVTSPTGLEEVSNGRLRSRTDLADGYTRFEWFVANPINNYDVSINIADYVHWKDEYKSKVDNSILSLDYYVLRDNEEKARKQFEQVKPMMDVFEKRFGKYAFYEDGYKLVETPYLGMEHQSCVAYGNAYKNGYMGFDLSGSGEGLKFDYIIIHESAHEWWGNSLTSYDIADMWIHEGFGQYSEVVYLEELYGKQSAINYLNGLKKGVDNKEPIIGPYGVNKEGSGDMYPKGALFLNTLRSVINNDSIWWNCILSLQKDYARKNISTEDVMNLMNAKTGLNLNEYFRQYLYFPNLPVLHLSMTEHKGSTTIKYYWESDSKNFNMPIQLTCKSEKVRLNATNSPQEMTFKKTKKNQIVIDESSFYFKLKND